jgi:hypothetical protein
MQARKVLEDRATSRQIKEMIHAMGHELSEQQNLGGISALKDLIVALSHPIMQTTNELDSH